MVLEQIYFSERIFPDGAGISSYYLVLDIIMDFT